MGSRPVLLVNPNRYRHPPVIPLGVEYLAQALTDGGFGVKVLDLCFSDDPAGELVRAVEECAPEAVCLSVRNVDSVLYPDPEYFLPEIRGYIEQIRALTECPVIVGGSALPADPRGVADFLGADVALAGPGELSLPALLREGPAKGQVLQGMLPGRFRARRGEALDYGPYLAEGGIAGFETHKGCSARCVYCTEAGTPVSHRDPDDVLSELRRLADLGLQHLHLCDSEFNEDPAYCLALLERMAGAGLGLRWALYMRPGNFTPRMFDLLRASGAYLVTLAVDTFRRPAHYWKSVEEMTALARRHGIRMSVDLLTGFPYEDEDTLQRALEFFVRTRPDEVVVNVFLRLYRSLAVTRLIEGDPGLQRCLLHHDGSYLPPVFYNHISIERLRALMGDEPLFRIAGAEKVVNYQKAP